MKKLICYYMAAVADLETIKKLNESIMMAGMSQFAIPMKPINDKLRQAKKALALKEKEL